jgi:hypothetical protein
MDLPALGPGRTAQALAVDRQSAQPTVGAGTPVGQPAAHRQVQRVAVDAAQLLAELVKDRRDQR